MNAKDVVLSQNTELKSQLVKKEGEIHQKGSEIRGLTSSVQTLENQKDILSRKNGELQNQLKGRTFSKNMISEEVVDLRKQLSDKETALASWVDENQKLRSQLAKKDTELRNQVSIVQRLQKEKTDVSNENRNLQDKNRGLVRENQKLHNQNTMLQNQLDGAKQADSNLVVKPPNPPDNALPDPALLKTVSVSKFLNPRAPMSKRDKQAISNNKGVNAFYSKLYSKAIKHFNEGYKDGFKIRYSAVQSWLHLLGNERVS